MKIYYAHINDFDENFFEKALEKIPSEKSGGISRFKNERAKKESILGWFIFEFGASENKIENKALAFSETGKPSLKNSPWHFNISHSDGLVCCAFSKSEVGLDIEKPKPFSTGVLNRVLCESEKAVLEKAENREEAFIRFWTLKEAYLKHSGDGISKGLLTLDFSKNFGAEEFVFDGLKFKTGKLNVFLYSVCSKDEETEFILFDRKYLTL